MKKLIYFLLLLPAFAFAQDPVKDSLRSVRDTIWRKGGIAGSTYSQTSLTNWAAGGQSSIAVSSFLGLYANYKKGIVTWDNKLELGYGMVRQDALDLRKSDDRIDFSSKYGRYAFGKVWYYSALFGFKTQFAPGYAYSTDGTNTWISDFMSPAYTLLGIGLDYKPSKHFSALISPLTGRVTIVMAQTLADKGAFGVRPAEFDADSVKIRDGENARFEFGGFIKAVYGKEIMKNVNVGSKLELFSNYAQNLTTIDVNWENMITMKVNGYISASLMTQLIYDQDVDVPVDRNDDGVMDGTGPRVQFKEVFGVGLSAKF